MSPFVPRRGDQRADIGCLGAGELGVAVDDGDDIALCQIGGEAEGILDAGVAGADHQNVLVDIFARDRRADTGYEACRRRGFAGDWGGCPGCRSPAPRFPPLGSRRRRAEPEEEAALLAGDRRHLGVQPDVELPALGRLAVPDGRGSPRACPPRRTCPERSVRGSLGIAMMCLPFWYLKIVSGRGGARSRRICGFPFFAARAAALMPAGPEPTMAIM